ncbi:hypothetical protein [Streptomyces sp. NPDC056672]|uniref:hypothetical protein n=1 Tax=Streptomyces sp. NPDC056672 TaxID=3345906 RepID=UPI0036AFD905
MVIVQAQPEVAVDLSFVGRIGGTECGQQAAECVHEGADLVLAHASSFAVSALDACQFRCGGRALGLDFTAPGGDECGVGSRFEGGAVPGELAVALGDGPVFGLGLGVAGGLRLFQGGE